MKIPNKLPKNPPVLKINEVQHEEIGVGCFSEVFKISPRRVIKIFFARIPKYVIESEIKGSKSCKYALPILKVVLVDFHGEKRWGLVKKLIPYAVNETQACKLQDLLKLENSLNAKTLAYDCHSHNVRKDSRGKLWMIDTQLKIPDKYL